MSVYTTWVAEVIEYLCCAGWTEGWGQNQEHFIGQKASK